MGKAGGDVRYLTSENILNINLQVILRKGGWHEVAGRPINPHSLAYLVEIVQAKWNDEEVYPSLFEKAAVYAVEIIRKHIFFDGNKRTGILSAFFFLHINGYFVTEFILSEEIIELTLRIDNGSIDISEVATWLRDKFI